MGLLWIAMNFSLWFVYYNSKLMAYEKSDNDLNILRALSIIAFDLSWFMGPSFTQTVKCCGFLCESPYRI